MGSKANLVVLKSTTRKSQQNLENLRKLREEHVRASTLAMAVRQRYEKASEPVIKRLLAGEKLVDVHLGSCISGGRPFYWLIWDEEPGRKTG